jgi:hypothetical protein
VRLLGVAAVVVVGLVAAHAVCGAVAARTREPLDWEHARTANGSAITMLYPRGWYATSNDGRDIVVASFRVSRAWLAAERKSVPERGVLIWSFTYGPLLKASDSLFPPRPARVKLDPKTLRFHSCGFNLEGYTLRFRDQGLAVQMLVALGPGADPRDALEVVNRLHVS